MEENKDVAMAAEPAKGVKEMTEVVDLILDVVMVGKQALADGKVGLEDAALLFKLAPGLLPAIQGLSEVPAEVKDLTAEEAVQVVGHVMAKLSVEDAKARAIIEKSLKVALAGYELVLAIKG